MAQYLVAIQHPLDYDGSKEGPQMHKDIDDLNDEMVAKGIRIFVGGMDSFRRAKALRRQPDGGVVVTDGPYLETKEHIGGFWVLECADMDEAMEWGRKAVNACRVSVEVRPFYGAP